MKSIACFLAPAALVFLFAPDSSAQSQAAPKSESPAQASTPKAQVQTPAATAAAKTQVSPNPTTAKSTRKSTLSRKSRKSLPPPPITSVRHLRSLKHKSETAPPTELDPAGRIDNAGKRVGFYPSVRGAPSNKAQTSANRKGQRIAPKKAPGQ